MTKEMMLKVLEDLGNDISFEVTEEGFEVTVEDFLGFDENWSEVMRDLEDPKAVEKFEDMLEEKCLYITGDFYFTYHFEDFTVELGYSSYNI